MHDSELQKQTPHGPQAHCPNRSATGLPSAYRDPSLMTPWLEKGTAGLGLAPLPVCSGSDTHLKKLTHTLHAVCTPATCLEHRSITSYTCSPAACLPGSLQGLPLPPPLLTRGGLARCLLLPLFSKLIFQHRRSRHFHDPHLTGPPRDAHLSQAHTAGR